MICFRYFAFRYFAPSISRISIFCTFDILRFDILQFDILQFRYFTPSIFCAFDILRLLYFVFRYIAFDILRFDILRFDILSWKRLNTPPWGFSRIERKRRRCAPPGFHPPYPPSFWQLLWKFRSWVMQGQVTRSGQVTIPHENFTIASHLQCLRESYEAFWIW